MGCLGHGIHVLCDNCCCTRHATTSDASDYNSISPNMVGTRVMPWRILHEMPRSGQAAFKKKKNIEHPTCPTDATLGITSTFENGGVGQSSFTNSKHLLFDKGEDSRTYCYPIYLLEGLVVLVGLHTWQCYRARTLSALWTTLAS